MSRARVYLRNITANWVGYGLNLVVMFFMSPFVVHTLGDERYGVWALLVTLTAHMGLQQGGMEARQ
jgi:O-antigen/teichoic acid export membrane protein